MNIEDYVKSCIDNYKKFMGIDKFPEFTVKSKEIISEKSQTQGFDAPAAVFYDIPSGSHSLEIWSKLSLPQMNAEYLVFHEFTHILDAETYSLKDKVKHMSNKGYTEYHAAQIDFMKLLGAKNITDPFSFNMDKKFETLGDFGGEVSFLSSLQKPPQKRIGIHKPLFAHIKSNSNKLPVKFDNSAFLECLAENLHSDSNNKPYYPRSS